jgi:hypothetical protein
MLVGWYKGKYYPYRLQVFQLLSTPNRFHLKFFLGLIRIKAQSITAASIPSSHRKIKDTKENTLPYSGFKPETPE